ncbi:DNA polymerase III subunit epsilon [Alcanivorax hongdengensis A-11-3]|uniref:Excinuclease cho n=1 Tax=Alcanivorax hongdengensis A-11-3 TaxID=1177179 RepID=L0W9B0_9GAMM|nr:GIY-YIG nuclease family protein [Alcanivorax hongdengensis]EKF73526.1 DNA polymerase III subunit epsilon [Alcanivorax hongdengensis A-11-3]
MTVDHATASDLIAPLPESPGVYRFFGARDELLYIGKSINIRQRVRSHFSSANKASRARRMCSLTSRIEHTVTAGELGALLLENREIKQRQPIFNRRQRRYRQLHTWTLNTGSDGFLTPALYRPAEQQPLWQQDCYGLYRSPRQAQKALEHWVKSHQLCPRRCGLEGGNGPCFSFQLGRCRGACCGKESAGDHNQRLMDALQAHQIRAWPYHGTLVIHESGADGDDFHLIHQWCHLATLPRPPQAADLTTNAANADTCFDLDSYRMLLHFLNRGVTHYVIAP